MIIATKHHGVDAEKPLPKARTRRGRGQRGSALFLAMLACLSLTAVALGMFQATTTATRASTTQKSSNEALAAAEHGASLAAVDLTSWHMKAENDDIDWVYGASGETLYGATVDQRRFGGTFGGQDFRVMVRSAELAKLHNTKPTDWLWTPGTGESIYEIISTARDANLDSTIPGERRMTSTVQTVLSIKKHDGWNGGDTYPTVFLPEPELFQVALEENIEISGEDHDINKYYVEKFPSEVIVTPLKLTSATANFMLADGGYWRGGYLTLNYRMEPEGLDANPHRPKTRDFGTGSADRAMNVANTAKQYDTYLLGGKRNSSSEGQGKTVTVDMGSTINGVVGRINETANAAASEGGTFNLVLGEFEDLRNLYINIAGYVGSIDDSNSWWQMYVGQYTHSMRDSDYNSSGLKSYPNYGGSRIRAQTAHLMKNEDGQVLVRLFKDGSNRLYKYPANGTTWTGYYCWADTNITKSGGVRLTRNVTASTTTPGESNNAQTVARTFFWQELVGYQLMRRNERPAKPGDESYSSNPYEPAIATQRNLPTDGGQRIDKRTIYRTNSDGERFEAGFDEIYQAHYYGTPTVPGNVSNSRHPLYGDKYSDITPGYLQDRFDSIYVWENGAIVEKANMKSFLFLKDFGVDEEGNEIKRDALALHIGYEDQRETTADFDYCDMVFTIYISPAVDRDIIPATMFTLLTDQWWEQNPDNGLTGNESRYALGTNSSDAVAGAADAFEANFDLLGYTPKSDPYDPGSVSFEDRIYTMKVAEGFTIGDLYYLRVKLEEDGAGGLVFVPALDEFDVPITSSPYYYTEDDVNNFLIHEWNLGDTTLATEEGRAEARLRFPGLFPIGYTILEMPERWNQTGVSQPVLSGDSTDTSYTVMRTSQTIRTIAAEILGYAFQMVPVVQTYLYNPTLIGGVTATPVDTKLAFLAGEMVQTVGDSELSPVSGIGVDHRDSDIEQPDGSTTPLREFVHANPAAAVAMCYVDHYASNPALRAEVEEFYGMKDKRFSIGFHRSGPDEKFDERHARDHYEKVSLGQLGFNPYMETNDGRYIAKNSEVNPNDPLAGEPLYEYDFKYGKDGLVPDFVFDKPIDGCGIMVVNGNLVVSDVFAYYGLLVVMGDVVVRPMYRPDRLVYGADGNPFDAYGHSIHLNAGGNWEYVWVDPDDSSNTRETEIQLDDENGTALKDSSGEDIPVVPIYASGADAYRGSLITQGNLVVNGRMLTEKVENQFAPGEYITGEIRSYANETAEALTRHLSDINKRLADVFSWAADTSTVIDQDVDKLWSGDN